LHVTDEQIAERLKRDDAYWTGPRFVGLLFVTLAIAITVIYIMSSLYYNDWTWHPLAHDPAHELLPSN
jgi:hypothetical protein